MSGGPKGSCRSLVADGSGKHRSGWWVCEALGAFGEPPPHLLCSVLAAAPVACCLSPAAAQQHRRHVCALKRTPQPTPTDHSAARSLIPLRQQQAASHLLPPLLPPDGAAAPLLWVRARSQPASHHFKPSSKLREHLRLRKEALKGVEPVRDRGALNGPLVGGHRRRHLRRAQARQPAVRNERGSRTTSDEADTCAEMRSAPR